MQQNIIKAPLLFLGGTSAWVCAVGGRGGYILATSQPPRLATICFAYLSQYPLLKTGGELFKSGNKKQNHETCNKLQQKEKP
ncbi:MAG: hypothetical protein JNK00_03305 [Flavipsychrobacter sp.]|nr:hypothetical protein [Flavipsychrobacter sp.]